MSNSKFLHAFLCFFFYVSFASSASSTKNHLCRAQQSLALLQFKQNLFSINYTYDGVNTYNTLRCTHRLGLNYHPQMLNWSKSLDCCKWDGVTCNQVTGDVIGLELSCGMLRGSLHPNSTIFHLPHLQYLNLAFNDFLPSSLPHEIGRFANTLTHLNISNARFSGQIPSEISLLSKLVSLDLSSNLFSSKLGPHVFNNLLRNSTHLRQLSLAYVDISLCLPKYLNISSPLELLDLSSTGLHGKLPDNIFSLPYLQQLDLSENYGLAGALPKVNRSTSLPLTWLNLQSTSASGAIPKSIGHLNSLNHLDLSHTNISGAIPYSIGHLNSLNYLDLSFTNLSGVIPYSVDHLVKLDTLILSFTKLSGEIPYSIGNLRFLNTLNLKSCNFTGSLPNSLGNLKNLTLLDLSLNKLNGTLPSSLFTLPSLQTVSLNDNMFSGSIPSELFTLQHLNQLFLQRNQLVGHIDMLDHSPVPSFSQLSNLTDLELSYNNFTGTWELDTLFSSLRNLTILDLSYSGLSVVSNKASGYVNPNFDTIGLASCKVTEFPNSLQAMERLGYLDLSDNQINGSIPNWLGEMGLIFLNISHNFITGLPDHELQWNVVFLSLASNLIQGPFPPSICNMSLLTALDMSNNFFNGSIPRCFGNASRMLQMVNLGNNNFQGPIPDLYENCAALFGINLNGNQLQGEVSISFSRCRSLKLLDLGNNNLNGTFPTWLGDLPDLQVLNLKSNKFKGPVESSFTTEPPFPSLRVLDLSQNAFDGSLPRFLGTFKAMQNITKNSTRVEYTQIGLIYYSVTLAVKGVLLPFPKISVAYTIVDLSNNFFRDEIPDVIGNLSSLIVLNFSHNSLTGRIPNSLGSLSEIESLDLSWNQLTGGIPQSLAELNFLSVLNLSQNHLVGRIPRGPQFNTFQGNSFVGNSELCGDPVPRNCEGPPTPQHEEVGDDEGIMSGFTWKVVMIGYGGGTLVGLVIGYFIFLTRKPKWFNAIVDEQELRIRKRHNVRYIHIGK